MKMSTHKQTIRRLIVTTAAALALIAGTSLAHAGDHPAGLTLDPDVCERNPARCGESYDYCDRFPKSRQCDDTPPPWYCKRHPDECGKPDPCDPRKRDCDYPESRR
jgi:hypothetical protein